MKNKLLLIIISSTLLTGCQKNTNKNTSNNTSNIDSNVTSLSSQEVNTSTIVTSSNNNDSSALVVSSNNEVNSPSNTTSINIAYTGYYASISPSAKGENLQKELTSLIAQNYKDLSYNGLLSAYAITDCKPGTNIIWDMYSNEEFVCGGPKENHQYSKEGDGYNREHSIPQSYFSEHSPMKSDLFHVYPTDGYVNNRRSNYPFGEVGNPTYTSNNGSKLGYSSFDGYNGIVFEPIDEYKGDFARTYFYFATRYPGKATDTSIGQVSFTKTYPYLSDYAIKLFTKWSEQDPISQKEIDRNNAVYSLQQNRNPFIDHPEFINKIFGGNTSVGDIDNPPTKTNEEYAQEVISLINAIGTVTKDSNKAINEAEKAYNLLTDEQKALVNNYDLLLQAKEEYGKFIFDVGEQKVCKLVLDKSNKSTFICDDITFISSIDAYGSEERGIQFTYGSISSNDNKLIFTSSNYEDGIDSITITCATNGNLDEVEMQVFIGGIELSGEQNKINVSSTSNYVFSSPTTLHGEIKIIFSTSQSKKSLYITSFTIN